MVVCLRDVSKRFANRWALARVTCDIPAGASVLLTGENGAGKTTFLRILATVLQPTVGEVELFGQRVRDDIEAVRVRLALLTHHNHLYEALSPFENLQLVARLRGLEARSIESVLERVGLSQHAYRPVVGFSAGMRRRVCIARLLLHRPELVLLDEPFTQLDPGGVILMEDIIRELHQSGSTLVIATHDIDRGLALCDRHLVLTGGRL